MGETAATVALRKMEDADLERVLAWRNHPDIRRCMFHHQEISLDEHRRWFERERDSTASEALILEVAGIPRGFVRFRILQPGIVDWGFYAAPGAPRGTGMQLAHVALGHAFATLGARKLCAQVLASNDGSVRFHERHGFVREGVLRQQHYDGHGYVDVICYGMLAEEWRVRNEETHDA